MPSVTPSRQSLFGHRERSGVIAQAIDEPRHGDKVDHAGDRHRYQPGDGHLPAWIPTSHHSPPARIERGKPLKRRAKNTALHRALITMRAPSLQQTNP
jgi:hypothetical protein